MAEELFEKLKNWGCDVDGALKRTCYDSDFYLKMLLRLSGDPGPVFLKIDIEEGDFQKALTDALTMKGVYGNLGITPIYVTLVKMADQIHAGSLQNMPKACDYLIMQEKYFESIVNAT